MDIKEYIASGIIDSYVLGAVSDQERQEVQCLSKIYPELKEELLRAEEAMERYAESIAQAPPADLKASILDKIKSTPQDGALTLEKSVAIESTASSEEKTVIRTLPRGFQLGAVASVLVIIGLSLLYLNASNDARDLSGELTAMQEELSQTESALQSQLNELQLAMNDYQERESFINAPTTEKLVLAGTDIQPEANATVYFDKTTQELILASTGMPVTEEGKQFQLWAIIDGNPVDLGVLDKGTSFTSRISVSTSDVQAFAITLEPDGGSKVPTLDQLYVIGNV